MYLTPHPPLHPFRCDSGARGGVTPERGFGGRESLVLEGRSSSATLSFHPGPNGWQTSLHVGTSPPLSSAGAAAGAGERGLGGEVHPPPPARSVLPTVPP